jgi:hypothetical protein
MSFHKLSCNESWLLFSLISPAGNSVREYRLDGLVEKDIPYIREEEHTVNRRDKKQYIWYKQNVLREKALSDQLANQ